MFVWLTLPEGLDARALLREAIEREGIIFVPGTSFFTDGGGFPEHPAELHEVESCDDRRRDRPAWRIDRAVDGHPRLRMNRCWPPAAGNDERASPLAGVVRGSDDVQPRTE